MADKSVLNPIMDKIIECFKARYENYAIYDYDTIENEDGIETPAILIQMPSFENAQSPIREIFRTKCTFRAYICESYRGEAKKRVRDTALDVAKFINNNDWGAKDVFNKASFTYATEDDFNEKINSSEVWYCEWEQEIYSNVD